MKKPPFRARVVREYVPGEYCRTEGCEFYRDGRFGEECASCQKYAYYVWLRDNGFRLLVVEELPSESKL